MAGDMAPHPSTTTARSESPAAPRPAILLTWDEQGQCTQVRSGLAGDASDLPALHGDGWLDSVFPDDRDRAKSVVASVLAHVADAEAGVRLYDGEAWAVLRVHRRPGGGADGVMVEASRSLGSTARLARLVETLNQLRNEQDVVRAVLTEGVSILGGSSGAVYVLEQDTGELVMMGSIGLPADLMFEQFARLPSDASLPGTDALSTGRPVLIRSADERSERYPDMDSAGIPYDPAFAVMPMYDASGGPFGVLGVGFAGVEVLDQIEEHFLVEVASHCAVAMHRARLTTVAEQNQEQLAFLDALSGALSRSLELETALTFLAEFAVPRLADWCAVRVIETSSSPDPVVGAAHRDPTKVAMLRELVGRRLPVNLVTGSALGEAFAAGQPFIRENAEPDTLARDVGDPDVADVLVKVGAEAVMVFPLAGRGRPIGALALGNGPGRVLRQDEFDLAQAAAARAAVLVDNARLFAERSEVAAALEDSLLPGVLPQVPGIELGARYRPAGQGLDVGGDFYDVFEAGAEGWVFAVGDVCGHGVEAASLTGLARHTIRSAALSSTSDVTPSSTLAHLNRLLLQHLAEMSARRAAESGQGDELETLRFCTVLLGSVLPSDDGADLVVCSAGHPLPFLCKRDGTVATVGAPGTLLGVIDDITLSDVTVHLARGETLVAYTDGVTDRRSGRRMFDERGVAAVVRDGRDLPAQMLAERIEGSALAFADHEPSDDMAVLVLRALEAD